MPGINRTGTPDTKDITLGRGALYFASLGSDSRALGFQHLGNANAFTMTVSSETIEHQSSRTGLKQTDKEVILSQKATLSMKLEEINFQNLANFLSGETADSASTTNPTTNPAIAGVTTARKLVENGSKGLWYDLVDNNGVRLYDIDKTRLTVTPGTGSHPQSIGSTPLTQGATADYDIDEKMGRIFIVSAGVSTTDNFTDQFALFFLITADAGAVVVERVRALTKTAIRGALKFIQINPSNSDKQTEYEFHSVSLKADGDFSLIGDDFTEIPLSGTAEKNSIGYPISPVLDITTHANA